MNTCNLIIYKFIIKVVYSARYIIIILRFAGNYLKFSDYKRKVNRFIGYAKNPEESKVDIYKFCFNLFDYDNDGKISINDLLN